MDSNWINQAGIFNVIPASGTATGSASLDLATVYGLNISNVAVQATITLSSGENAGLVADYSGPGDQNYYLGGVFATATGYQAYLYRNVNGVFTSLLTTPNPTFGGSADGVLRLEVYGSSLKVFLGNTLLAYGEDSTFTGGSVGMRVTAGASVSNFSASALTAATPSLPFSDGFTTVTSPEANQLTSNWINQVGNYSVNTTSATATGTGTNTQLDLATLIGISANNVAVQATITSLTNGQYAGLVADYSGSGDQNYYLGGVVATATGYQAYLYRKVNGVFTSLLTTPNPTFSGSADGVLRLEVYGSSLKLFLGGNLLAYGDDSTLTSGSVGMRVTGGAVLSSFSASALTLATPTLPFTDGFTTVTSPEPNQLTNNWINQAGNYSVNTGTGTAMASGTLDLATLIGISVADVTVQANVSINGMNQNAALVSRYTGSGDQNYYLGGLVNTGSSVTAYLYKNLNGVFTLLQSTTVSGGATSGTLEFVTSGTSLTLTYNGVLLLSATDSSLSAGSVGLRSTAGATITSFSASAPVSGLPFSDNFSGTQLNSANWVTQTGSFAVASNAATGNGTDTQTDLATLLGVNGSYVAVLATFNVANGEYAGLVADYSGSGDQNYYLGGVVATATGYQAYIYRNVNGVFTSLLSTPNPTFSGSVDGVLRLEVYGSSLKLFLGSNLLAYGEDSTFTGGSVGMRVTGGASVSSFSASALTVGTPSLPFSDGFTTVTSPVPNQLTNNWINQVGNYSVNTGTATATGNGTGTQLDLATLIGVSANNVAVQATITSLTNGQYAGLVADYSGSGDLNYYLGGVVATATGYQAYIYRKVNGVFTSVLTTPNPTYSGSADGGVLRLEVYGSSLKLYLSNNLIAYGEDATLTGGSVGMRVTAGAALSNFSASQLTVATPSLPFSDNFTTVTSPEANQLTSNWINEAGNYSVSTASGTATGNGTSMQTDLATLIGVSANNVAVQASITSLTNGEYAGLVADYSGPGDQNYYLGGVVATATGYQAYLYRNVNGVFTSVLTTPNPTFSGSADGVLRLEVYGSSLKVFLGGNLLAYGEDATLTGGSVGMRVTTGAVLSNFIASTLTVATPTLPFTDNFTTVTSPEANQLSSNWINEAGNYSVNTTSGTATAVGAVDLATLSNISMADATVQANVNISGLNQNAALVSRYSAAAETRTTISVASSTPVRELWPTCTRMSTASSLCCRVRWCSPMARRSPPAALWNL